MNCVTSTKENTEENARCVRFLGLNNELHNFINKKHRGERKMWVSRV